MYGEWGIDLTMEARRDTRSVTRGIGPVMQRLPLDIERTFQECASGRSHSCCVWGPSSCLGKLKLHFCLRQMPGPTTWTRLWPSDCLAPRPTRLQPVWSVVGGCLCSVRGVVGCLCLSAELQLNFLGLLFGDLRLRDDLPFFPSSRGTTVEKSKVVGTFEHVHAALGLPVRDEDGHRLLGGHSMRLAGARLLAASGITCIKLSWWLGGDHRC